jgi:hypothetical protein
VGEAAMTLDVLNAVYSFDYLKRRPQVILELSNSKEAVENEFECIKTALQKGKPVTAEIKAVKPRRSLDANAYMWVLIGKLSEKTGEPMTSIYREAIKEIGGNRTIVCVEDKAVEELCSGWRKNGIGWVTDTMPSKIQGCTNVILYYGSSTYDSSQMTKLVDVICAECEQENIETMTPAELARLKEGLGNG